MVLPFIDFDKLASGRHGLMDASSIAALGKNADMLTQGLSAGAANEILRYPDEFDLRAPLSILERWIVVDNLAVDLVALDSLQGGKAVGSFRWEPDEFLRLELAVDLAMMNRNLFASHIRTELIENSADGPLNQAKLVAEKLSISATMIPFETVHKSMDLIGRTSRAIQDANPKITWNNFAFGLEKEYGEVLGRFYGHAAPLARSNLGVERTLFYYETAAAASVPLVLHPNRYEEVQPINHACQDAFGAVKKTICKNFEEQNHSRREIMGISYDVSLPALVIKMIHSAGETNASIVDATKELNDSLAARSFRKWLADIQANLMLGTTEGKLRALESIRVLSRVTPYSTQ